VALHTKSLPIPDFRRANPDDYACRKYNAHHCTMMTLELHSSL